MREEKKIRKIMRQQKKNQSLNSGADRIKNHNQVRGGETMKIAHFCYVGPNKSGMYETTRELCSAELEAGYDSCLIDTSWYPDGEPSTTAARDRGVDIKPLKWSENADLHVLHSVIPQEVFGKAPVICMLHGAPEYVFYSEVFGHEKGDRGFSTLLLYAQNKSPKVHFVTLWERHVEVWKTYLGDNVSYVPSCVDLEKYKMEGEPIELKNPGKFNIGFCDSWRETYWKDPFRVISGVRLFYEDNDDVRLHFFSIPREEKRDVLWDRTICAVQRTCPGLVGGIYERVVGMDKVYRALDVVVSPVREESRIVRESAACGTPVITMKGKTYTDYTADFSNPQDIKKALELCKKDLNKKEDLATKLSDQAKESFDYQETVNSLGRLYSKIADSNKK